MKKILKAILVSLFCIFPVVGFAATKDTEIDIEDYNTLGLEEVLIEEEIEEEFSNYSVSDNQVPIYLFRGNGCTYCRAFLTFLNSITDEYGKYFKLVSFETWYDKENSELLETISEFIDNPAQGVPYIIIGENVFPGYASDYDDSIKSAITTLYESKDRYDVFEAYNKEVRENAKKESSAMNKVIIWNFIFTAIATAIIIIVIKMSINSLNISRENNIDFDETELTEKEEVKTTKKKPTKKK